MRFCLSGSLTWTLATALGLSAGAYAADSAPERAGELPRPAAAAEADGVDEPADAMVKLILVPSNVNLNRSISFDDAGEPQHRNNQLSIGLRCFYETQATPLSCRDLEITSAITSAGEELEIDPNQQRRNAQNIHANRQRHGKPYFDLYPNLPAPTRPAAFIRELRGQIKIDLSRGPERVLRLSPVSEYVGKRFRVTDMNDSPMSMRWIQAQDNQPGMVEWTYARSLEPLVQDIKFYRRNGVELEVNGRGSGGDNTSRSQRFEVGAADEVVMVVRLFREAQTVEVPFVVRDLPLPVAQPGGPRFDLAIATEPVGEGGPPVPIDEGPADVAAPGIHDLPIIILD
ncbi:MAG: hypothetical protein AAF086_02440 [Planctomycetota bacterium]